MIENPYRKIRRRLKLSTRGIGNLSSSTIVRIEGGVYEELSDRMVGALFLAVTSRGVDVDLIANDLKRTFGTPYLAEAYQKWRRMKRAEEGDRAEWPSLEKVAQNVARGESPMGAFARLVSGSVEKFCKRFCLQAPTVARYAEGKFEYASGAPEPLREALTDAGYDKLDALFTMHEEWLSGK